MKKWTWTITLKDESLEEVGEAYDTKEEALDAFDTEWNRHLTEWERKQRYAIVGLTDCNYNDDGELEMFLDDNGDICGDFYEVVREENRK